MERFNFLLKSKLDTLPKTAGVYAFSAKGGPASGWRIIYIGKAASIKDRVKNHFQQPSYRDDLFIQKVNKIGFFETGSEIEALILEANLIKKYQPKYNVLWRDDKNYFYVAIAKNEKKIPYVYITHQKLARAEYIGPFIEGTALKKTLRFLRRAFPFYTIAKHPKTKCTWCHLDLCPGPYEELFAPRPDGLGASSKLSAYKKNIQKLVLILKGKRSAALRALKKEMNKLSKEKKFEDAGKIRDKIYALQQIMAHTHVINGEKLANSATDFLQKIIGTQNINRIEAYDVSNIQGKEATSSMVVFTDGAPDKSQYRKFRIRMKNEPNDIAMLKETLTRRFSHAEWPFPNVILIDGGKAQLNVAIEAKKNLPEGKHIKIISIAKGRQELFIEGKKYPIPLRDLPQEVYNLVKYLDDEAHRFAITYHKVLRKKKLLQ